MTKDPTTFPAGSTFTRDSNGEVVMHWPSLYAGGTNSQLVDQWVADNCPPGTTTDVVEVGIVADALPHAIYVTLHCPASGAVVLADVDPERPPAAPRVFHLVRYDDVSHVSGTGIVAQGMQARDGHVALRWCVPDKPATWNLFESIDDMLLLNGHKGRTVVKWVDGRD